MGKKYGNIEPPAYLLDKVIARIDREERLLALKRRVFAFFVAIAGLIPALVYAFGSARSMFVESGFSEYSSLIFSDTSVVLSYWQSFFLTLLETFPIMETAIFLGAIFILLQLLKLTAKDIKIINNMRTVNNQYGS
ncbi:MAG: hypothetical protein WC520_00125 [Candidatus Paceibacterota bacterium]